VTHPPAQSLQSVEILPTNPSVFTTASPPWPPFQIASPGASSTEKSVPTPAFQQDFVLFDERHVRRPLPSHRAQIRPHRRPSHQPLAAATTLESNRHLSVIPSPAQPPVMSQSVPAALCAAGRSAVKNTVQMLSPVEHTLDVTATGNVHHGSVPASDVNASATISPQPLFLADASISAPNSASLTALTSPSETEPSSLWTPDFDFSPDFDIVDMDGSVQDWFPLFPQVDDLAMSNGLENFISNSAPTQARVGASSSNPVRRNSSVAGVAPRNRNKPLPPIIVDDAGDVVAMKRARNTLAARKSRERKQYRLEELEREIARLAAERDYWKAIAELR